MTAAGCPLSIDSRNDTIDSVPAAQITTLWHARAHVGQTFSHGQFKLIRNSKIRLIRLAGRAKLGKAETLAFDPDQGNGDPPVETDVDIATRPAAAQVVVARVKGPVSFDFVAEGQGGRVERAKNHRRLGLPGCGVGEIDIPECAGLPGLCHQPAQDRPRPVFRPLPVNGPPRAI